jgi:hypothetical protein
MRRAIAIIAGVLLSAPAFADREPTPAERERIEQVLRAEGYVSWEEIELDDGVWEIDDARTVDGREYDLKLDPETLGILDIDEEFSVERLRGAITR